MSFGQFMNEMRAKSESISDPDRSTVAEELDALDWQLSEIARTLTNVEKFSQTGREYAIKAVRRHLDTAIQRSHRAKQIAKGLRVPKSR